MNILIPVLGLPASGGNRVLSYIATEWVKLGHRVAFLSHKGGGRPYFPTEAEIIWFNDKAEIVAQPDFSSRPLDPVEFIRVMWRAIVAVEKEFDILLLNHSLTVWPAIIGGVRRKCFYYVQLYEPEVFFALPSFRMKLISVLLWATYYALPKQRCIVNCPMYVNYKNIRTSAPVVPPGINLDMYWKKSFHGFPERLTIGVIGRIATWKGVKQAVDSARELIRRGHDIRLRVAYGLHMDAGELSGMEEHIEVVVPKDDPELAEFYRSVDIMFALASIQHGAPHYPVIESMACGTPVVTTGYYPGDEETTFLVRKNDPTVVADCVEAMLRAKTTEISCRLNAARMKVSELSWSNVSALMMKHIMNETSPK